MFLGRWVVIGTFYAGTWSLSLAFGVIGLAAAIAVLTFGSSLVLGIVLIVAGAFVIFQMALLAYSIVLLGMGILLILAGVGAALIITGSIWVFLAKVLIFPIWALCWLIENTPGHVFSYLGFIIAVIGVSLAF